MDRNQVIGQIYSSKDFVYLAEKNSFVSKISDTPGILRQLWVEEFALGFGIRSVKTGRIVYFTLSIARKDEDGNYLWWQFSAHNPDNEKALQDLTVLVFND